MSRTESIREKIQSKLNPSHLEVINESRNHNVADGAESHFKVTVVSDAFAGRGLIERHRSVNELFSEELASGAIHALALHTYAPEEWHEASPDSPDCLGGSKK